MPRINAKGVSQEKANRIVNREYTTPEIAKTLGEPMRKVLSMLERGYFKASIQEADGHHSKRLFNFWDVLRAYIIHEMVQFGVSVNKLRYVSTMLNYKEVIDGDYFVFDRYTDFPIPFTKKETIRFIFEDPSFNEPGPKMYIPVKEMRVALYKKLEKLF